MRKIEQQMLEAIRSGVSACMGNTVVAFTSANTAYVILHGNVIAEAINGCVLVVKDTFKAWPTRTTVSRLRALGIAASIRKGKPCINGVPV